MNEMIKRKGSHTAAMFGLSRQEMLFTIELLKDMNPIRAGQACGIDPDEAMRMSNKKAIKDRCEAILVQRLDEAEINVDWLLDELKDNHTLARQQGNLTASNKALETIGKLAPVDAFASNKVEHSGELGLVVQVKRYGNEEKEIQGDTVAVLPGRSDEGGRGPTDETDADVCFL
jgi:hypothetical protein